MLVPKSQSCNLSLIIQCSNHSYRQERLNLQPNVTVRSHMSHRWSTWFLKCEAGNCTNLQSQPANCYITTAPTVLTIVHLKRKTKINDKNLIFLILNFFLVSKRFHFLGRGYSRSFNLWAVKYFFFKLFSSYCFSRYNRKTNC